MGNETNARALSKSANNSGFGDRQRARAVTKADEQKREVREKKIEKEREVREKKIEKEMLAKNH